MESKEYYDSLKAMRDAIGDVLDISEDTEKFLDGQFFVDNAKLIEKAAKGDEKAIDSLREAASKKILIDIALGNQKNNPNSLINVDDLTSQLDQLQKNLKPIKVGTEIDINNLEGGEEDLIKACNKIIADAEMTSEQATALFESIGFTPTFVEEYKEVQTKKPITKTVTENETEMKQYDDGTVVLLPATRTWSYTDGYTDVTETIAVPSMSSDGKAPEIKTLTKTSASKLNNYSSKNKGGKGAGGGGGKSDKVKHINTEIDRYHKVNTQITKVDNTISKLQSQQEKLVGSNLLNNLNSQ